MTQVGCGRTLPRRGIIVIIDISISNGNLHSISISSFH